MSELSDTMAGWGGCLSPVPTTPRDGARCLLSCSVVLIVRNLHPGSHGGRKRASAAEVVLENGLLGCEDIAVTQSPARRAELGVTLWLCEHSGCYLQGALVG